MIFFDTETTGLVLPAPARLEDQPRIIEFGAIKVDSELNKIAELGFLCDPGIELPPVITKITGIKPQQLRGKAPFKQRLAEVVVFFEGEKVLCTHNCTFDTNLLYFELLRAGMEKKFPWPTTHVCTVEHTMHIQKKRMKLENLHKHLFNEDPKQTHRALEDVELLIKVYKELVNREMMEAFHGK